MIYPRKEGGEYWMLSKELKTAFFCDIETTGLKATESEVITAAWIVADYETLQVKANKFFKFRPAFPQRWSSEAEAIHGISLAQALQFPDRKEAVADMVGWLLSHAGGGFPQAFICHAYKNGTRPLFDWEHLKLLAFDHGHQGDWGKTFHESLIESTDTFGRYAKENGKLPTENMKLNTLADHFKIPLVHHDAKSDVIACYKIYKLLRGM